MTTQTITPTNNRLTLTLDDNFVFIISKMKASFPLLKDTDLVKMAVGGFYNQNSNLFMRTPDKIEQKVIDDYIASPELASDEEVKELENELGINLLVGSNKSGKSNFITALNKLKVQVELINRLKAEEEVINKLKARNSSKVHSKKLDYVLN